MRRKHVIVAVVGVLALGTCLWAIGSKRLRMDDRRKLAFAERLVATGRPEEAIAVINSRRRWPPESAEYEAWMRVSIDVYERLGNVVGLGQVYYDSPHLLHRNEAASLLAARALILKSDINNFERLRSHWRGREDHPHAWTILEADSLLRRGRRAQATALLAECTLQDHWESSRHVRLALLHASEPADAWRHLSEALSNNPDQAIARLFRAQILEAAGRNDEARLEYVAARLTQPHNAALCDQLAEFYRRRGNYRLMLDTWCDAAGDARADFIDLKTEFWSRVAVPLHSEERPLPSPGPLEGLVRLLRTLPKGVYWDAELTPEFDGTHAVMHRPEVQWLQRLQLLRDGREDEAIQSLQTSTSLPWESSLRRSLLMVLNLRQVGELDPQAQLRSDVAIGTNSHPLIVAMDAAHANQHALPAELRQLLCSEHGLALTFLAHGWLQVAVELDDGTTISKNAPAWAAYGMAQANRLVASPQGGIQYARRQHATPELTLLIGELALEQARTEQPALVSVHSEKSQEPVRHGERIDDALRQLQEVGDDQGAVGRRANWLAIVALLESERLNDAQQWLQRFPWFAATREGREIQARIALTNHDVDAAEAIYRELVDTSIEARVYFAKKAAHDRDWDAAEHWTLELLKHFPADQDLLYSLREIRRRRIEKSSSSSAPDTAGPVATGGRL